MFQVFLLDFFLFDEILKILIQKFSFSLPSKVDEIH